MDLIQGIGYLSGFIISVALIPQVFQAWKTKSTKGHLFAMDAHFISGPFALFYLRNWNQRNAHHRHEWT